MKYKYSINNDNQLLVIPSRSKTPLKPKGEFQVNKNNQLEYWLNEPLAWRSLYKLPGKIVFEGKWNLNANHDLELKLNKARDKSEGERLTLKGDIISVENNVLAFEIISRKDGSCKEPAPYAFRILKLTGKWQADEYNRLVFKLEKREFPDEIIFGAAWKVNQNQQIEYSYTKKNLITNSKVKQSLTFEGFWKINSSRRIRFNLTKNLDSGFDFQAQVENPNIYPQKGLIKYRLGAGIRQTSRSNQRLVALYGEWKFNRRLGLIFRMDYGEGNIQAIEFGAEVTYERNKFLFNLKDEKGKPLGITLSYTYSLLNSLEPRVFIRLKSRQKELGIEAGLSLPF